MIEGKVTSKGMVMREREGDEEGGEDGKGRDCDESLLTLPSLVTIPSLITFSSLITLPLPLPLLFFSSLPLFSQTQTVHRPVRPYERVYLAPPSSASLTVWISLSAG